MPEIKVGDRFISGKQKFEVESYTDSTITLYRGLGKGPRATMEFPWRVFAAWLANGSLARLPK